MDDIYLKVLGGTTVGFCYYHISTFDDKRQNEMTESGCLLGPQHIQKVNPFPFSLFYFTKKYHVCQKRLTLFLQWYRKLLKEHSCFGASQNMTVCYHLRREWLLYTLKTVYIGVP